MSALEARPPTTAVILCGGRGRRLGGIDKPLVELAGKTLLAHIIERLEPQVDAIVLAGAGSRERYQAFGYPVVPDREPDQGPLAGIVSALAAFETAWTLTTPADTPFLPEDLVSSLAPCCHESGAAVVMAGGCRQNLTMLFDRRHAASMIDFYACGGRAVHRWLVAHEVEPVELAEREFFNINTPQDLRQARALALKQQVGKPGTSGKTG